jgi:hypothetical protein
MGEDDSALRRFCAVYPHQLLHQKLIGQAMESIAPHALRLITSRDRQDLGHARQIMVKIGIETGDLRRLGKLTLERLYQRDLFRQMLWIEQSERSEFLYHFRSDALRFIEPRTAMHHAMPYGGELKATSLVLDAFDENADRCRVVRRCHGLRNLGRFARAANTQSRARKSNLIDRSVENPGQRFPRLEERELYAR